MKLKRKNIGNVQLTKTVDKFIEIVEGVEWKTELDIKKYRNDADNVHNQGFYFFDLSRAFRTLCSVSIKDKEVDVVWTGSHKEYELTFKNHKNAIATWLRNRGLIK